MKLAEGSAPGSNLFSQQSNLLDRAPSPSPDLTSSQIQVDALVSAFLHQGNEWKALTAMMAGGMAYRVGRIGVMGLGTGNAARALSIGIGLTSEVSAFVLTNRGFSPPSHWGGHPQGGAPTNHFESNLWKWSGSNGLKQGLLQSFITFGTLKLGGRLAQRQHLNLQHGAQDLAMIAGHQLVYRTGIGPKPEGSFAEQMIHAEATNLQLGAGMALGHGLTGGRLITIEKGLDLSLRFKGPTPSFSHLDPFGNELAFEGTAVGSRHHIPYKVFDL